jgi:hypothetical protein
MRASVWSTAYTKQITFSILLVVSVFSAVKTTPLASADLKPASCDSLTASSNGGSQYTFTTLATSYGTKILGYRFNFGDHQSYEFQFSKADKQNRQIVSIVHYYKTQGIFSVSAYVNTARNGISTSTTSGACHMTVIYGPTTLVNTGAGNTIALFTGVSLSGATLFEIRQLRRNRIKHMYPH